MTEALMLQLLQSGGPMALFVMAAAYYVKALQRSLNDSQERRVDDAQKVTTTVLELVEEQNAVKEKLADAINKNTVELVQLREELHRRPA